MSTDTHTLGAVVEAVLDGRPVDWASLSSEAADPARSLLRDLRVVASLASSTFPCCVAPQAESSIEPEAAPLPTLATWGHLQVLEHLGSGGHGDVYLAYDPELDRRVALKLLVGSADGARALAIAEARHLARVRHPHVVTVHGAARHDGVVGIWMEYVPGRTLAELFTEVGLPLPLIVGVATTLCGALTAVHAAGLVHGDVKPQNVMLEEGGRVVLMDFGTGCDVAETMPATAGTPRYLAPELLGGHPPSVASDVYALGVLVQDLLASAAATARGWRERRILQRLRDVLITAVAERPQARWPSMAAFAAALHRAAARSPRSASRVVAVALLAIGVVPLLTVTGPPADDAASGMPKAMPVTALETPPDVVPGDSVALNGEVPLTWTLEPLVSLNLLTGGRTVWVTSVPPGVYIEGAVISADAERMAYCAVRPRERRTAIHVVDRHRRVQVLTDQSDLTAAMLGPFRGGLLPALLAHASGGRELVVFDVRTREVRTRVRVGRDPAGFGLSPDLRWLAYDASEPGASTARRDLRLHALSTGEDTPLVTAAGDDRLPTWTNDGKALLYVSRAGSQSRLMWLPVDRRGYAGAPRVVMERAGELRPVGFDAAGRAYVAASHGPVDVMVQTVVLRGATAEATRVSHGQTALWPHWAPNGERLVWARPSAWLANELIVFDLVTGTQRAFAGTLDALTYPRWSPDGTRIAAWGVDPRTRAVQVLDVRTGELRDVARRPHPAVGSAWGLEWTGDGRGLLVQEDQHTLVAMNLATGDTRQLDMTGWRATRHGVAANPQGHGLAVIARDGAAAEDVVIMRPGHAPHTVWSVPPEAEPSLAGWVDGGRSLFVTRQAPWPHPRSWRELWRLSLSGAPPQFAGVRAHDMYYAAVDDAGQRVAYQTGSVQQTMLLVSLPRGGP